jgi:hypothetical protein
MAHGPTPGARAPHPVRTWRPPVQFAPGVTARPAYRIDLTLAQDRPCLRLAGDFTSPSARLVLRGVLARMAKLSRPVTLDASAVLSVDEETAAYLQSLLVPSGTTLVAGAA